MFRLSLLVGVVVLAAFLHSSWAQECIGTTVPDPEDCHGYFLVLGGVKLQQYCAPGMKYDKDKGACVVGKCPPCNCADPDPGTGTPTPTPEPGTDPDPSTPTPTPPDPVTPTPGSGPGTDPDPSTPTPTPPDPVTPTPGSGPGTDPDPSTPTPTPPDPVTPTPGPGTDPSEVDCNNVPNGSFFAHAEHCRLYWVCREGVPVLLHCEKGMWFDANNFVCNFPYLVDCPANID